ncbi:hypothetical protein ACPXCE_28375 [Streptomyces sp. DT24]|uniref:hypothetical protein n=1 Tax=Streptomyces sp. DT24 TaxID=3416520 RepID=UPI003CF08614
MVPFTPICRFGIDFLLQMAFEFPVQWDMAAETGMLLARRMREMDDGEVRELLREIPAVDVPQPDGFDDPSHGRNTYGIDRSPGQWICGAIPEFHPAKEH